MSRTPQGGSKLHRKPALGTFAVCLSGGLAQAQTAPDPATDPAAPAAPVGMVLPEGFTPQTTPLTAEELLGATIHDISGNSSGKVHDLVFAAPETAPVAGSGTMAPSGEQAGQITHAILDIGGFLGMGQHRIALPVSDLRIYRSDSDLRVYLSWTRDQMTALPAYDENDPATLDAPLMTP